MKRYILLQAILGTALVLASCSKSFESADETDGNGKMFTATIENHNRRQQLPIKVRLIGLSEITY